MKGHVQICHLTKFDSFGVNRDVVIDLETWLKSIQMSEIFRQSPQKTVQISKMCYQFCDNSKILSFGHHLKEVEMKITHACPFLRVSQKLVRTLTIYVVLGDAVSRLQTFVWI